MSPAGRPRKPNPKIPAHIDQVKIPRGLYFAPQGFGRWYVLREGKKVYVASVGAKLSELHAIMEDKPADDTLAALVGAFEASDKFRKLSASTQKLYRYIGKVIVGFGLKDGRALGQVMVRQLSRPLLQRVVDRTGDGTPTKGAHVGRYLSTLAKWGERRGKCPAALLGTYELPVERADPRVPEQDDMASMIAYARLHGAKRGVKGSVAPYLWAVASLAYLCRLRGVEVLDLTDASAEAEGLRCRRRKGSDANVVPWTPDLREAWDFLAAHRDALWNRRKRPVPLRADARPLVVDQSGDALARRALTQSWGKLITAGIAAGIITRRFGLHGLKHRGITDTAGTRADKRQASGHRTEAMVAVYDHSVPLAPAANLGKIPRKPAE